MKKSKLLTMSLALCLVAILAFGSLAYFTAQDSVTNNFKVASTTDPDTPPTGDDIFDVEVTETEPEPDADDEWTAEENDDGGYDYSDIAPGDKLPKDPTVTNTGAYDEWIRVHVTLTKANEWAAIVPAGTDLTTIFGGFDSGKWTLAGAPVTDAGADTVTYTYYLNSKLVPNASETLFTEVNIPAYMTADQFATVADFSIVVTADAIQTANTGATPAEAFVLYDNQVNS